MLGKEAIIRLKEEEFQTFLSQRRSRKYRERRARTATENDDFDEDDTNQIEEADTFVDEFEINRENR